MNVQNEKNEAYKALSRKEYELDEKKKELEETKDAYRKTLVRETAEQLLKILKEEQTLKERDFEIFLEDLSVKTRNLYAK